jgi:hypothetical protein
MATAMHVHMPMTAYTAALTCCQLCHVSRGGDAEASNCSSSGKLLHPTCLSMYHEILQAAQMSPKLT